MALLKECKDSYTGVVTNYHKISKVMLLNGVMHCGLDSYVSQEYRSTGTNVNSQSYHFTITVEEEESMGIRQLAYKKIKELPEWEGAEDC